MKKILAATTLAVTMSLGFVQATHAQIYPDVMYAPSQAEVDINIHPRVVWFFKGVAYWVLEQALDAAWAVLQNIHYDDNEEEMIEACSFLEEHEDTPDECLGYRSWP